MAQAPTPSIPGGLRAFALAAGGLALLVGMGLGLSRLGWGLLAGVTPAQTGRHGPLMVSGFLGTLISVERAVGLGRPWGGLAPAFAAAGTLVLLFGGPVWLASALTAAAALGLVAIYGAWLRLRREWPVWVLLLGGLAWLGSALVWLAGRPVASQAPWWAAFVVLTIAAERLELSRLRPARGVSGLWFATAATLVVVGAALSAVHLAAGVRTAGAGMAVLGLWLARYDVAWRTVRLSGLTRYVASCLLPGYGWLTAAGLAWVAWAGRLGAGPVYDAMLHALFVGFVLSMVFGHAPVILPGVAGVAVPFSARFYLPVALLHLSLLMRVAGDLAGHLAARQWGGLLNGVAVVLFLAQTVWAVRHGRQGLRPPVKAPSTRRRHTALG